MAARATDAFHANWSDYIAGRLGDLSAGDNGGAFYDPTQTDVTSISE